MRKILLFSFLLFGVIVQAQPEVNFIPFTGSNIYEMTQSTGNVKIERVVNNLTITIVKEEVGINDFGDVIKIEVYSNENILIIKTREEGLSYSIYPITGKEIIRNEITNYKTEEFAQTSGVYIVDIFSSEKRIRNTYKVIVK